MTANHRTFLVFLGPPGSGKGTQARSVAEVLGIPHVSTGDLFRHHIKNLTELGQMAKTYMDRGELVPDEVTIRMVEVRLAEPDAAAGAILDGFPRTLAQAAALDKLLAADGGVSLAPLLAVDDAVVMRRITGRRLCRICDAVYHIEFNPPRVPGICDLDGGELCQRVDDKPDTVYNRLYVYYKQTSPLVGYYFAKGLLAEIDGELPPREVQASLLHIFDERGLTNRAHHATLAPA